MTSLVSDTFGDPATRDIGDHDTPSMSQKSHVAQSRDSQRPWPRDLAPEAFHGVVGRFIAIVEPETEADPVGILLYLLMAFGSVLGRSAYWSVGATKHYLNLFGLVVGATASGRKGTGGDIALSAIKSLDPVWAENCRASGLASGEGLIYAIRDPGPPDPKGMRQDLGVEDKRLFVEEAEFANVFKVNDREANTLSTNLRLAWDGKNLRSMVKNHPTKATEPHISLLGQITIPELTRCMGDTDTSNGFLNRFLIVLVRRKRLLPLGGQLCPFKLQPIIDDLRGALVIAKSTTEMGLTPAAKELWTERYGHLTADRNGVFGSVTARGAPIVRRLACIYAALDRQKDVDVPHMLAALEVWRYSEDSCRFLFGEQTGDPIADKILASIRASENGITRSEIVHGVLNGHVKKSRLEAALDVLRVNRLAHSRGTDPQVWTVTNGGPSATSDICDIENRSAEGLR